MKTYSLELLADYFQFYLQDDEAQGDLSLAWNDDAVERMFAVADGVVGIGTARNTVVPVTLELLESAPDVELAGFDHVVEGALEMSSGRLVVAGCTDYRPAATRFDLAPGTYRVRLAASGFDTLSDDGLGGQDHYRVQIWPGEAIKPRVLKQGEY